MQNSPRNTAHSTTTLRIKITRRRSPTRISDLRIKENRKKTHWKNTSQGSITLSQQSWINNLQVVNTITLKSIHISFERSQCRKSQPKIGKDSFLLKAKIGSPTQKSKLYSEARTYYNTNILPPLSTTTPESSQVQS